MKHEEAMKKWHERTVKTTSERAERHSDFNPNDVGKKTSSWQKVVMLLSTTSNLNNSIERMTTLMVDGF